MGASEPEFDRHERRFAYASDGVAIAYGDFGPRDGRPLVLCHGLGSGGDQFFADAEYFAGQGYRVLVPDLRGHARSTTPATHPEAGFTIGRMADDLTAMLDDADVDQVDWVGNSLGGIVALSMLGTTPERFRTFATLGTAYTMALPRVTAQAFPLIYGVFGRTLASTVAAQVTTREASARPLVARMLARFDPRVGEAVVKNVVQYDFIANATAFPRPILLMRGGRDYRVNAGLKPTLDAMQARPNFTFVRLKGGGHCANLDANLAWRAALTAFWRENAARIA